MILGSGNFQITGKYYQMQVARHGRVFHTPATCQIAYKIIISGKLIFFLLAIVNNTNCSLGLLRVSEYSDIRGSEFKIEYEYSSLPKSLDRVLFFFILFLKLKQEVFHKMVR